MFEPLIKYLMFIFLSYYHCINIGLMLENPSILYKKKCLKSSSQQKFQLNFDMIKVVKNVVREQKVNLVYLDKKNEKTDECFQAITRNPGDFVQKSHVE